MTTQTFSDRAAIERHQLTELRKLIAALLDGNEFYAPRLRDAGLDGAVDSIGVFTARMAMITKDEIVEDQRQHPPYGTNLTFPLDRYTRLCQTSGTTGRPLRWLDTADDWQRMLGCWQQVYAAAGAVASDRAFFAFSFGPFLGFWTAFEAAAQLGMMCIPGGGMSSPARLAAIFDNEVTVLCCTPTYAIRLAEVAETGGFDMSRSKVRRIIVAGEPGGSVPATRARLERLWPGASVFDHHGMTEVGPVTYENPDQPGVLHVIESHYLAEVIDPKTHRPVAPGECGELVLTTLARVGAPLLRYRTGDMVRPNTSDAARLGRPQLALEGGILGRSDDMVLVRGVNVYPSAVDQIVRRHDNVAEYRVEINDRDGMTELRVIVEPVSPTDDDAAARLCEQLSDELREAFQLRVPVSSARPHELPRFEFKARRWVRLDT
jgi:phenylacetate-CoA ligase